METGPWVGTSGLELLSWVGLPPWGSLNERSVAQDLAVVSVIHPEDLQRLTFFRLLRNPVNANSRYCIKYVHLEVCALLVQL